MKAVTIVVAIINDDLEQVKRCLSSIDRNRFEVIIVCSKNYRTIISIISNELVSFKAKTTNHNSIRGLWREGGKSSTIGWTVFRQSSDIFTV